MCSDSSSHAGDDRRAAGRLDETVEGSARSVGPPKPHEWTLTKLALNDDELIAAITESDAANLEASGLDTRARLWCGSERCWLGRSPSRVCIRRRPRRTRGCARAPDRRRSGRRGALHRAQRGRCQRPPNLRSRWVSTLTTSSNAGATAPTSLKIQTRRAKPLLPGVRSPRGGSSRARSSELRRSRGQERERA